MEATFSRSLSVLILLLRPPPSFPKVFHVQKPSERKMFGHYNFGEYRHVGHSKAVITFVSHSKESTKSPITEITFPLERLVQQQHSQSIHTGPHPAQFCSLLGTTCSFFLGWSGIKISSEGFVVLFVFTCKHHSAQALRQCPPLILAHVRLSKFINNDFMYAMMPWNEHVKLIIILPFPMGYLCLG